MRLCASRRTIAFRRSWIASPPTEGPRSACSNPATIERTEGELSVAGQCALLGVARGSAYYRPRGDSAEELALMRRIGRVLTDHPMYGSRRVQAVLAREGTPVGRRHIRRLMCRMRHARGDSLPYPLTTLRAVPAPENRPVQSW